MKTWMTICLLALSANALFAENPTLSFSWEGGLSPYRKVRVSIDETANAIVELNRYDETAKSYKTKLNDLEVAELVDAISRSGVTTLSSSDSAPVPTDAGRTVLAIKSASTNREIAYEYLPVSKPIEHFVWRLVTQADLSDAAQNNPRMYQLLSAIDPRLVATKVLQPYAFRLPLAASLGSQTDFQQLAWRLQALSFLTTPTEFAGLVSQNLNRTNTNHWRFWLTTLSTPECYNNLRDERLKALFPIFRDHIRRFGDTAPTVETPEGEAFCRFKGIMQEYDNKEK